MPSVRRDSAPFAAVSSVLAPVVLVGGFTFAAARQRAPFDSVERSISALAARDADARGIMTCALVGLGLCHVATALGLRAAPRASRAVLAFGGLCTLLVAAFPLDRRSAPAAHAVVASVAFLALAAWPLLAARRTPTDRGGARSVLGAPSRLAAGVLFLLLAWFAVTLARGVHVGLAERVAATAEALWPIAAVLGTLARTPRAP